VLDVLDQLAQPVVEQGHQQLVLAPEVA